MEKKIYNSWAFSENAIEKGKINSLIFKELKEKYKVFRHDCKMNLTDKKDCNFKEYDVIIGRKPGYHYSEYYIYKNTPQLTNDQLALLCDGGNLCFGHSLKGAIIYVSED